MLSHPQELLHTLLPFETPHQQSSMAASSYQATHTPMGSSVDCHDAGDNGGWCPSQPCNAHKQGCTKCQPGRTHGMPHAWPRQPTGDDDTGWTAAAKIAGTGADVIVYLLWMLYSRQPITPAAQRYCWAHWVTGSARPPASSQGLRPAITTQQAPTPPHTPASKPRLPHNAWPVRGGQGPPGWTAALLPLARSLTHTRLTHTQGTIAVWRYCSRLIVVGTSLLVLFFSL
jgi:hypothetical protein